MVRKTLIKSHSLSYLSEQAEASTTLIIFDAKDVSTLFPCVLTPVRSATSEPLTATELFVICTGACSTESAPASEVPAYFFQVHTLVSPDTVVAASSANPTW